MADDVSLTALYARFSALAEIRLRRLRRHVCAAAFSFASLHRFGRFAFHFRMRATIFAIMHYDAERLADSARYDVYATSPQMLDGTVPRNAIHE